MQVPPKASPLQAAQSIQRAAKPEYANACSTGPIADELATLAALCTSLENGSARIEERFGSVLAPANEQGCGELGPPSASMLHAVLQTISRRLRELDAGLCALHDRCTL